MSKKILDACCGSRMFWFDKKDQRAVFMDIRRWTGKSCDGRAITINPDVIGDFRNIPFADELFSAAADYANSLRCKLRETCVASQTVSCRINPEDTISETARDDNDVTAAALRMWLRIRREAGR